MSTDFLSQDEVDALLKGVTGESDEPEGEDSSSGGIRAYNIGTGAPWTIAVQKSAGKEPHRGA